MRTETIRIENKLVTVNIYDDADFEIESIIHEPLQAIEYTKTNPSIIPDWLYLRIKKSVNQIINRL